MISTFYVVLSLATLNLFFDKCYLQFIACSQFIANSQVLHGCCKYLILNGCDISDKKPSFLQSPYTCARKEFSKNVSFCRLCRKQFLGQQQHNLVESKARFSACKNMRIK